MKLAFRGLAHPPLSFPPQNLSFQNEQSGNAIGHYYTKEIGILLIEEVGFQIIIDLNFSFENITFNEAVCELGSQSTVYIVIIGR